MQWLESLKAMISGAPARAPNELVLRPLTPKAEQAAANQEWEAEGGCVKPPETKPGVEPAAKIPL